MEFGKLADISQVNFGLPIADAMSRDFLKPFLHGTRKPKIFAGPTGWGMPQWVGKWYPAGTGSRDFLKHYSAQFNTIEHNSTFYGIPDVVTVERWKSETEADFKFCPKVPQSISRATDLGVKSDDLKLFLYNIAHLGEKIGCCFLQLPPYFSADAIPRLENFFEAWDTAIPLAVEVRHPSFFDGQLQSIAYFRTLQYYNKTAVITDVAGRRDILHQKITSEKVMVRFVGNGLHRTDYERINEWIQRLRLWCEWGLEEVFFFIHQPDNLLAPELTLYLTEEIRSTFDAELRVPAICKPDCSGSAQMSLF